MFGIYKSKLDGTGVTPVVQDSNREMTHARVSPNGQYITFTRYNTYGADGKATEEASGGYSNTEICLCKIDGSELVTLVAPKTGVIAANSSWSPSGESIIFISSESGIPQIIRANFITQQVTRIPTPLGMSVSDPHWVGSLITFAEVGNGACKIWVMNANGTGARKVSNPPMGIGTGEYHGDYDPKLSSDLTRIACMRNNGTNNWKIVILNLLGGSERVLTPTGKIEGLPVWTPNNMSLVYLNMDLVNISKNGIWTMSFYGTSRQQLPISGMFPSHANTYSGGLVFSGVS